MNGKESLSAGEALVMRAVWECGETVPLQKLLEVLRDGYGKDYARTTVVTYLLRLSDKGFLKSYKKGKFSFIVPLKTEEEYLQEIAEKDTQFWFRGSVANYLAALHKTGNLTGENLRRARKYLDELED